MKKKEYLIPEMEIVKVRINQNLLTESLGRGSGTKPAGQADAIELYYDEDEEDEEEDW